MLYICFRKLLFNPKIEFVGQIHIINIIVMIKSNLLKEYISLGESPGFFGYGKWSNEIYIIGIEEAGCYSESLIQQKIDKYNELEYGDAGLFDNRTFQYDLTDYFDPKLINYRDFFDGNIRKGGYVPKIATLLKQLENSNLDKYEYVCRKLGSKDSNHSLIEILPLPCPKVIDWKYSSWVDTLNLTFMKNKSKYRNEIISQRAKFIQSKINENNNKKLIIFLANGNDKINYWNKISPINLNGYRPLFDSILYHIDNRKMYVVLPFPGSRSSNGIFNSYEEVNNIARVINNKFQSI